MLLFFHFFVFHKCLLNIKNTKILSSTTVTIENFQEDQIDFTNLESARIRFKENNGLLLIYNSDGYDFTLYFLGQPERKISSSYGFLYMAYSQDYIEITKTETNTDHLQLYYTAIPNFNDADQAYVLSSLNNYQITNTASEESYNIDFNKIGSFKLVFASPLDHEARLSFDFSAMETAKLTYINNGEIREQDLKSLHQLEANGKTMILEYTIQTLSDSNTFAYESLSSLDLESYGLLLYSSGIPYTTGFIPPNGYNPDVPATGTFCCCVGDDLAQCTHCPPTLSITQGSLSQANLDEYYKDGGREIHLYISGQGSLPLDFSSYEGSSLTFTGYSSSANIVLTLASTEYNFLSITNSNLEISAPSSISFTNNITLLNSKLTITSNSDVNIKSTNLIRLNSSNFIMSNHKLSLSTNQLECPISSFTSISSIDASQLELYDGTLSDSIICTINIQDAGKVNYYYNYPFVLNSSALNQNNLSFIGKFEANILSGKLDLTVSNSQNSLSTIPTFIQNGGTVNLKGELTEDLEFILSGTFQSFNFEGQPLLHFAQGTSISINSALAMSINWSDYSNCSVSVDTTDIYSIIVYNDHVVLNNLKTKNNVILPNYGANFINGVDGAFIELERAESMTQVPDNFIFSVDDGTTTALRNWYSYSGERFEIRAIGAVFTIRTFESLPPSNVVIISPDGTEIAANLLVIPYPSPVPTQAVYIPEIAAGTICGIVIIFAIILIIFFTPFGNMLGLRTYGICGKDPHKYDFDDDVDAEIVTFQS